MRRVLYIAVTAVLLAGVPGGRAQATGSAQPPRLVPQPVTLAVGGSPFEVTSGTSIVLRAEAGDRAAAYLAGLLRKSTGFALPVVTSGSENTIVLDTEAGLGEEAYRLDVTTRGVVLVAGTGEGLFRGVQTLRQLLPAAVESGHVREARWTIPGVSVRDQPRFGYRGVMLDVARHFFTVAQIERYLDHAAAYKVNTLHLHLSDDQGWRIAIKSWPRLTSVGGKTAVGGDPGGYLSQADYKAIVAYAAQRYITVIPEIDTPGHTNAALASYAALNCDGKAREPYTGVDVGFSSLCTAKDITYRFLDDVIGELARLTPGPYINIGGDEAASTKPADYQAFITKVEKIVESHGKRMMGWEEIAGAPIAADSLAEHWNPVTGTQEGTELARAAVRRGVKLVMAPADRAYLDMKYTAATRLGQDWAGLVEVRRAYDWDPARLITGVGEEAVAGVEAPIWTETMKTTADLDFMAFPRLPGIAEIGWSPASARVWADYRLRLAAQGPRWTAAGIGFYRSPQIPWLT